MTVATEFERQALQFAVVVAGAGQAVLVVVGKNEFHRSLAGVHDLLGVGENFHTLAYGIDAGGVSTQSPHLMHFMGSIVNLDLISPEMAPTGHLRAHAEQPLQASVIV